MRDRKILVVLLGLLTFSACKEEEQNPNPISGENHAPVAQDLSYSLVASQAGQTPAFASDEDGDAMSYSIVSGPSNGSISGEAPNLTYTPNAGYLGTDEITYKANDGKTDSNVARITLTINSAASLTLGPEAELNFGVVKRGSHLDKDFLLTNTGQTKATTVTILPTNDAFNLPNGNTCEEIEPQATCVVKIRFLASAPIPLGPVDASVTISFNDGIGSQPRNFPLKAFASIPGALDLTYSPDHDGKATDLVTDVFFRAMTVRVGTDNKAYIAGRAGAVNNGLPLLMRLNADGTVDTTFGTAGRGANDPEMRGESVSLTLERGGILRMGKFCVEYDNPTPPRTCIKENVYVARNLYSGAIDTAFNAGKGYKGFDYLNSSGAQNSSRRDLWSEGTGAQKKIYALVRKHAPDNSAVLLRINPDGTHTALDLAALAGAGEYLDSQTHGATGHMLISGRHATTKKTRVIRLTPAMAQDNTFGTAGVTELGACHNAANYGSAMRIRNGRIYLVRPGCIIRLNLDNGRVDKSIGDPLTGVKAIPVESIFNAVEMMNNGKIVMVGAKRDSASDDDTQLWLTRYLSNGERDLSFGTDGYAEMKVTNGLEKLQGRSVAIQPDLKIVVTGIIDLGDGAWDSVVARFLP